MRSTGSAAGSRSRGMDMAAQQYGRRTAAHKSQTIDRATGMSMGETPETSSIGSLMVVVDGVVLYQLPVDMVQSRG